MAASKAPALAGLVHYRVDRSATWWRVTGVASGRPVALAPVKGPTIPAVLAEYVAEIESHTAALEGSR